MDEVGVAIAAASRIAMDRRREGAGAAGTRRRRRARRRRRRPLHAVDTNKDGAVTRDELKATFDKWYTEWDTAKSNALTQEQLFMAASNAALPAPAPAPAARRRRGRAQRRTQTPEPEDVTAMMAALPATAPAKPKQPRKVLVLAKAGGLRALVDSARRRARSRRSARRPARGRRRSPTMRRTSTTPT